MPLTQITTSNIDTTNSLFFRNRIINGAMMIDQRNAGASFTNSNQNLVGLDRWRHYGLSGAVLTLQQSTVAPAGFFNSQSVTVTTSTTANDSGGLGTKIEGNNVSDFNWGTSSGSSVTASFWVRSSVTGTYNVLVSFAGSTSNYYYVATYTVSASNTWEYKTITIAAPPVAAGVFNAGLTAQYAEVRFVISSSGGPSTTANTWSTSATPKSTGCVDLASNAGATFYVTGVQLEKGTAATAFEYRPFALELVLCQRYFEKTWSMNTAVGTATESNVDWYGTHAQSLASTGAFQFQARPFKVLKRAAVTMAFWDMAGNSGKWTRYLVGGGPNQNNTITVDTMDDSGFRAFVAAGSSTSNVGGHWTASAEL